VVRHIASDPQLVIHYGGTITGRSGATIMATY